jgi:hypothetical protein
MQTPQSLSLPFPKYISEGDTKHEHVSVGRETQYASDAYTPRVTKIRGTAVLIIIII